MGQTISGRPFVGMAANPVPRMERKMRRPEHRFYQHFLPHVLQPVAFAPVLPGETLKQGLFQARVLSTPVTNRLTGWWFETYTFYCKHRHLQSSSTWTNMMIDLNTSLTPILAASDVTAMGQLTGQTQIALFAYRAVVNEFFRGDGEDYTVGGLTGTGAGLNFARIRQPGWWDSILPAASLTTLPGGIADDTIGGADLNEVGELGQALATWEAFRNMGITNLEYDDWLRSFGVKIAAPIDDRPELVRYTREWQEPATTVNVDATAQRISAVLSWKITERMDKDRLFREPGVLMTCVVARPKIYHSLLMTGIGNLASAFGWQTPFSSNPYAAMTPLLNTGMTTLVHDTRDLYLHGDQFRYAARGTLPTGFAFDANGRFAYPDLTYINSLFTDGANGYVFMDGVVQYHILGHVAADATPTTL